MRKTLSLKTLLDVQLGTDIEIEGMLDKDDYLQSGIMLLILHTTKLFTLVKTNFVDNNRDGNIPKLTKNLGVIITFLSMVCNTLAFDLPDENELNDILDEMDNDNAKNSSYCATNHMLSDLTDLFTAVLDPESLGQDVEYEREEIEEMLVGVLVGVRIIADLHGIDFNEVLANAS